MGGLRHRLPGGVHRGVVGAAALAACAPQVRLTVHHAPDVPLPAEVRSLSAAPSATDEAAAAIAGFRDQLHASTGPGWIDDPAAADAVVRVVAGDVGSEVQRDELAGTWTATRTARVGVSWELRARDGRVLDALDDVSVVDRWSSEADSPEGAAAAVVDGEQAAASLYWSAGAAYARRIVPLEVDVTRRVTVRGDPRLRQGHYALRAGALDDAVRLWSEVARSAPSAAIRARALHDLAVAFEIRGDLHRALDHADRSLAARDTAGTARYREALARSVAAARTLRGAAGRDDGGEP